MPLTSLPAPHFSHFSNAMDIGTERSETAAELPLTHEFVGPRRKLGKSFSVKNLGMRIDY